MPNTKWFRVGYATIIILLIIYLLSLVDFIFIPFLIIFQTLFPPIILGGVLFYLSRPLVNLLNIKIPRTLAIVFIYILFLGIMTGAVFIIGPPLQRQIQNLIENSPLIIKEIQFFLEDWQQLEWVANLMEDSHFTVQDITTYLSENIGEMLSTIGSNILNVVSFLTNTVIIIVVVPFVLFFLLKDGSKLPSQILRLIPNQHKDEGRRILNDMDGAVSSYVQGQIIVSFCVGVLAYIAYLIIGLEYSLLLALVAMVTNVIPVIGPFIGTFPAVIVGFVDTPLTALWVIIAIVIVQQIESNLISPLVMGRTLSIHPLTIILLLLVASKVAGLLGLILAVPIYAVVKVIVKHTYRLIKLRYEEKTL